MAKGSAMGLWRGKKGSSVFYRIANSNSQQKQGIRERNYEPANPQTTRQADQRLKLLAAQRVYGAIKPIISRAWQGVKYGQMTRQAYLRAALSMTGGYPYLVKDDNKIVPGSYQIARGSLNTINTDCAAGTSAQTDIQAVIPQNSTVGQAAQSILELNPWAQEGDQLTFVVCTIDGEATTPEEVKAATYIWTYNSLYLDPNDTSTLVDAGFGGSGIVLESQNNAVKFSVTGRAVVGAAVVLSRLDQTSNTYLRSTTVLAVADSIVDVWQDTDQRQAARRSYQHKTGTLSADWPVEEYEETDVVITSQLLEDVGSDFVERQQGAQYGTISGVGTYLKGEAVTLQYTLGSTAGLRFVGWYVGEERVSTDATYTFQATRTTQIDAVVLAEDVP